jgi:hypothetical protein
MDSTRYLIFTIFQKYYFLPNKVRTRSNIYGAGSGKWMSSSALENAGVRC